MTGLDKLYNVIIAGAGPVGMMLASELSFAGASVLVIERDPSLDSGWKHIPALYRRGLLGKLADYDVSPLERRWFGVKRAGAFTFGGHYAGLDLNAAQFDLDRCKYRLRGPVTRPARSCIHEVTDILSERARSHGATILWAMPSPILCARMSAASPSVDFEESGELRDRVIGTEFASKVRYLAMATQDTRGLRAVLVRPDGKWLATKEPAQGTEGEFCAIASRV
ncbi:hypothetical protein MY11210_007669 [Beauveria gryllotalpidicola]